MADERAVDYKDAKAYADKNNFSYFETSAKTKINVDKAFTKLTQTIYATKMAALQKTAGDANARRVSLTNQSAATGSSAGGDSGCAC